MIVREKRADFVGAEGEKRSGRARVGMDVTDLWMARVRMDVTKIIKNSSLKCT